MNDLTRALAPKSDQLNSDDLIGGPRTIIVSSVRVTMGDQPISISYEGDGGKPWKPCKGMGRLLMEAWGDDATAWKGRAVTLYRDPRIKFGPDEVGGIRVSHMSHIPDRFSTPLTIGRGRRQPYAVKRIAPDAAALPAPTRKDLVRAGQQASERGTEALRQWWESVPPGEDKRVLSGQMDAWKRRAADVDAAAAGPDEPLDAFGLPILREPGED